MLLGRTIREAERGERGWGPASVAIVDRTALWRTTRLVSGDLGSNDPFIVVADMATIFGAVIFDDRVVVFGDEEIVDIAARANALLGRDDVIRPISFNPDPDGEQPLTQEPTRARGLARHERLRRGQGPTHHRNHSPRGEVDDTLRMDRLTEAKRRDRN